MKKVYCENCKHLRRIDSLWFTSDSCKKFREEKNGVFVECVPSKINKNNDCKEYEPE